MKIKREPLNVVGLLWLAVAASLFVWLASFATGEDRPIYKPTGIYAEKKISGSKNPAVDSERWSAVSTLDIPQINNPLVTTINLDFLSCDPWFEVDQRTGQKYNVTVDHMFKDHAAKLAKLGIDREFVNKLNTDQRNRLHGKLHGELPTVSHSTATTTTNTLPIVTAPATPRVAPSGYVRGNCPGGFCPIQQPSVYRRGRR